MLEAFLTGGTAAVKDAIAFLGKGASRVTRGIKAVGKQATKLFDNIHGLLTKAYREISTDAKKFFEKFKQWLDELVEAVKKKLGLVDSQVELERRVDDLFDHLGGKLYTEKELKLLKIKLKEEYGVDLRLIDKELGYEKLPVTKNGKTKWIRSSELFKDWERRRVVGKFHEGPPPVMILRSNNASELTVFHEKVHLEIWYNKLPKMHIVDEEKMVFEAIWKARNEMKWTEKELFDSYRYINQIVRDYRIIGKKFDYVYISELEGLKYIY